MSYYISINPFLPTVPTFAVRETDVSRHNGGTSGAPLKPFRDDRALRALSSLGGGHEWVEENKPLPLPFPRSFEEDIVLAVETHDTVLEVELPLVPDTRDFVVLTHHHVLGFELLHIERKKMHQISINKNGVKLNKP